MQKSWKISTQKIVIGLVVWLIITNLFTVLVHTTEWWPVKIVAFLCFVFLPGIALLFALQLPFKEPSKVVLYSFGLSILVLMCSGLLANQLFPLFGVTRPLESWWAISAWNGVTAVIIGVYATTRSHTSPLVIRKPEILRETAWLIPVSIVLPFLAAAGAFRLNNGGDALFALITLGITALFIISLLLFRKRLPDGFLAWSIFSIGLTILLMTSLRGWDIVGHDIEREFRVYSLAHLNAAWDIESYRDPYNACLSITVLPEMLGRLLDISGLVQFKVIFQIIFAACPAVLYILLRQYTPKLSALAGALLFICYPTFINDSAMLTRQGIAYVFFALSLLVLANAKQDWRYKTLFVLCALGAILSHYSTAYMFVALFGVALGCKYAIIGWHKMRHKRLQPTVRTTILSPVFAVLIFGMTFVWYSQVTHTSGGLGVTIQKSLANIPQLFSSDNKSSDTSTALLFANSKSQVDLYESYLTKNHSDDGKQSLVEAKYLPALTDDVLPVTKLGKQAYAFGIKPAMITMLRQNFAKILQLLSVIGVLFIAYQLLFRRSLGLEPDFVFLGLAGIFLLALMVILPVLSLNYGILRAFQQALIFLLLPIVLFLAAVVRRIPLRTATAVTTTGIVILFFLFTGVFAQLLGGTSPSLSLNNTGLYYGLYYTTEADAHSFTWMQTHIAKKEDVRAANFNRAFMHSPDYPFARSGILPSQIGANTYVYLDPAQIIARRLFAYHESSPLIMEFPIGYYDDVKNQIYSTSITRVYK